MCSFVVPSDLVRRVQSKPSGVYGWVLVAMTTPEDGGGQEYHPLERFEYEFQSMEPISDYHLVNVCIVTQIKCSVCDEIDNIEEIDMR